ncbi:hypothetical protein [Chryseobacterium sp. Leaf201]|uniref:hypothetical protein n=1 Tax=Chryseobacterium sp. Leaf201 TaxID=1735672 RepID=UPI000B142306|nr:hypothetical protein [Chryseobacterium sp. Leaf201]
MRMILKNVCFIIMVLMMANCKESNHELSQEDIVHLKNDIIENGNEYSYIKLSTYNENMKFYGETLPFSLIMINKYNYKRGYDIIAEEMIAINNNGLYDIKYLKNLNAGDRDFVLYYLKLGLKEEDIESIFLFEKIYRNGLGINKNIKKADSLKNVYTEMMKNTD